MFIPVNVGHLKNLIQNNVMIIVMTYDFYLLYKM